MSDCSNIILIFTLHIKCCFYENIDIIEKIDLGKV